MTVIRRELDGGWRVRRITGGGGRPELPGADGLAATVPGCIHTDLLAAALIPDPYLDDNETDLRWIGESAWEYAVAFTWDEPGSWGESGSGDQPAPGRGAAGTGRSGSVDLVFDGLDTVATVVLNGVELGRTANMHRTYRWAVRDHLRRGDNHLAVTFAAPLIHVAELAAVTEPFPHSNVYPEAFNLVRKMACNFGWDWGPQLTTVGIWRSVRLETWATLRLAAVRPHLSIDGSTGRVEVEVEVERAAGPLPPSATVTVEVAGVTARAVIPPDGAEATVVVEIPEVERWWPHTHGSPQRYELTVSIDGGDAAETWRRRVGFRTVHVDSSPDERGSGWRLHVNDVTVWVRGANWIPDDCFPSRIGRDRYRERIEQAVAANIDLLRVWGGGIYEDDRFYEICDELGVMVWQDFLFACAAYPETAAMTGEVEAEARDTVTRLMPHPSLVLWNGNNENLWGHEDWDWRSTLGDRAWGAGYYFDLLPRVVAELDPTRPYVPGSPWSGPGLHPNDPDHGLTHIWDVWNDLDYTEYRRPAPRFVAEFGYQGPATFSTLRHALSDEPLTPESPGMRHHQKAVDGEAKLLKGLIAHFGDPADPSGWDFDDWHYLAQVNQARAVTVAIEHFRANRTVCSGSIVWQLNDCWPVTSWSAVDGDGRRKPLWYALRRIYADRLVTVQPTEDDSGGGLRVVAINDSAELWRDNVTARRLGTDGRTLAADVREIEVAPQTARSWELPADLAVPADPAGELLDVRMGALRTHWFWVRDRDLSYAPPDHLWSAMHSATGTSITVTARTLMRDVCLFPDRLDPAASVDDLLVTLLPGESHTFEVAGFGADPAALASPPVLRCVNDIPGIGRRPQVRS